MILQELLAYIVAYLIINIIYRELLVKRSECQEDADGNCRQVMMTLMSVKINISRLRYDGRIVMYFIFPVITIEYFLFCVLGILLTDFITATLFYGK